jgi:uncharacterized membrane protein
MSGHASIDSVTSENVERIRRMENSSINRRTFGEHVADIVTKWVGSWTFLIVQSILLAIWLVLNLLDFWKAWDPYPFVLLNLVLSFQAAFATPIILMSENRQARLSERRNQLDLQINLLAEQENTEQLKLLRLLCEKAGVKFSQEEEMAFEQSVNPDVIIRQIVEKTVNDEPHRNRPNVD